MNENRNKKTLKQVRRASALEWWNNNFFYRDEDGVETLVRCPIHNYMSADSGYITGRTFGPLKRTDLYKQAPVASFRDIPKWFRDHCGAI